MSAKISDLMSKYIEPQEPEGPFGDLVQMTVKFPEQLKVMLETMAFHYGVKKSPFLNELITAAIEEAWETSEKYMEQDVLYDYHQEIQNIMEEGYAKSKIKEEADV